MKPEFKKRISQIDWVSFDAAYGPANKVPKELLRLAGNDHDAAMDASHLLWCGLCHQHAYLSSAALPAYPFILEVLDAANDQLTIEILDIFFGFAVCSTGESKEPSPLEWERELRSHLYMQISRFKTLAKHENEEIAGFAERIVENLTQGVA